MTTSIQSSNQKSQKILFRNDLKFSIGIGIGVINLPYLAKFSRLSCSI